MKISGIYLITCNINGKRYVGQSIDIQRRRTQHRTQSSNKYLKEDIEKDGIDAFKFDILEKCTLKKLTEREDFYIKALQPEYNIALECHTMEFSQETREKMRLAKIGKPLSVEHRKKISLGNFGKKKSEEACRKHFRSVLCVETGVIYESVANAAESCGIKYNSLSATLHGRNQTSDGYHWKFVDESHKERKIKPCKDVSLETRLKRSKPIRCIETGEIFPSIKTAAEQFNIKQPNISAVLYGKQKTAGGFHWEYCDPNQKCSEKTRENLRKARLGHKHSEGTIAKLAKSVRCVETGRVFVSIGIAAKSTNTYQSNISKVLLGKRQTAGGFHWEYYCENEDSIDPTNHYEQAALYF